MRTVRATSILLVSFVLAACASAPTEPEKPSTPASPQRPFFEGGNYIGSGFKNRVPSPTAP